MNSPQKGPQKVVAQAKLRVERARARYSFVDVTIRIFKRYSESDGGNYAAALTYYTFFSIFPLLLFAASILGYLTFGNEELQQDIFDAAVEGFPMLQDAFRPDGFQFIEERRRELALTGMILALYSGTGAVVALEHALNKVNRVDEEGNWLSKRFDALKWLGILGVGTLLSVAASALAGEAADVFDALAVVGPAAAWILLHTLALAVAAGVFATAFKFLPNKAQAWRDVLPGAIVAAVAFELLKTVGSLFVTGSESRNATFGTFAAAAGLLITCYLASQATLLAAEVNAVLSERRLVREPASANEGGNGER
jgi:YihY family inner membrane protein